MEPWIRDRNCFSARFQVDPAKRETFLTAFQEICKAGQVFYERGCKFAFQGWGRNPDEFVVFASWDEDVVGELRATADFQQSNERLLDCCNGPMIMEQFNGMDKDRSVFESYPAGQSKVHVKGQEHQVIFL